jgi:ribosomal protein S12 methylthiotransferase
MASRALAELVSFAHGRNQGRAVDQAPSMPIPTSSPLELLDVMRREVPTCAKYRSMRPQHISDNVLSRMRRHVTRHGGARLLRTIRETCAGITLRTTLLVGFPARRRTISGKLLDFVREMRFERMGCLSYSARRGNPISPARLRGDVWGEDVPRRGEAAKTRRAHGACNKKISARRWRLPRWQRRLRGGDRDRKEGRILLLGRHVGLVQPDVDRGAHSRGARQALKTGHFYQVTYDRQRRV